MMKILINRTDAIGDTILTMPMARMLKEKFSDVHITFLISPRSIELFADHPYVDEIRVFHPKARWYFKLKEIWKIFSEVAPTHYFYVGGATLPSFMAWLRRVSFRGGLKSRWHSYLFLNRGVRQKRSMVTMHESEYNLNLLSPLGIEYHHKEHLQYLPQINLQELEVEKNFEAFINELKTLNLPTQRRLIFVHPGMTGHTLNWSPKNYARFILKMDQKFPEQFLFVISHTPSDAAYISPVKDYIERKENEYIKDRVYFFNGQKNGLRHYMSILKKASLFIGPSTGTTHIAATLGVPVVGIYSPIKIQSSLRWGPLGQDPKKVKTLVPDVVCGERISCALKSCPYYECMGKIEVEDAVLMAQGILN